MRLNRRQFLAMTTAATLLPQIGRATPAPISLRAEQVTQQILPAGQPATQMLGFNGTMPGPEIRLARGQDAVIDVENMLDQGTAVHWHGIRIANAMDGVPELTQPVIESGQAHRYSFTPPDAGTFWYHSHHISYEQVARGLMGPLIIEEETPPDVNHDITVLIADWRIEQDAQLAAGYDSTHAIAHDGYMGNFARAFLSQEVVRENDRVRFRLINAATNRVFPMTFGDAAVHVVALDGMPLTSPRPVTELTLAPAQRADLIVDITSAMRFQMQTRQDPFPLAEVTVQGINTTRATTAIEPLPPHSLPRPAMPSQHLTLTMAGGAMGGRHGGDNIWSFNDISDLPAQPFGSMTRGETVRITMANDTAFAHGIHLHGHHFYEVNQDGTLGDLRDTTLIPARESRDVLCVFDNPGQWLLHCHMLSHSIGGMRTWVEVA